MEIGEREEFLEKEEYFSNFETGVSEKRPVEEDVDESFEEKPLMKKRISKQIDGQVSMDELLMSEAIKDDDVIGVDSEGRAVYKNTDVEEIYGNRREIDDENFEKREKQFIKIQEIMSDMKDKGIKEHLFFIPGNKGVIVENSGGKFFRGVLCHDSLAIIEKDHLKLIPFEPDKKNKVYFYSNRYKEHRNMEIPSDAAIKKKGVAPKIDLTKMQFESAAVFAAFVDSI